MTETVMIIAGIVAIVAGCMAVVVVSLRSPWPRRVRWLVATNALGCWGMPTEPIMMREVFVVDLWSEDQRLSVIVRAWGSASRDTTLVAEDATVTTAAQVARWRTAGTPLLLVSNRSGRVSLHGPTRVVSYLAVHDGWSSTRCSSPDSTSSMLEQEHPL